MKIQFLSDLHLEFGLEINKDLINPVGDLLIIAGDLNQGLNNVIHSLKEISKFTNIPILYVLGNHEYYDSFYKSRQEMYNKLLKLKNIYLLDRNAIEINNILFIGATGWTDGSYDKYIHGLHYPIEDLRRIGGIKEADGGEKWGKKDIKFISTTLRENYKKIPCVVITHHAPTPLSLAERYRGSKLNLFFINNWSKIIDKYSPKLWIHGHCHNSFDYQIYNTRVVCNPSGYFGRDPNPYYQADGVIEI
jgi:Icc-related predicted phosphoesterase